jgi:hypothetical protein
VDSEAFHISGWLADKDVEGGGCGTEVLPVQC